MSQLEDTLSFHLKALGLPAAIREYRFDPTRRWRADFAWPDRMVIAEVHGGTWTGGRHVRPKGIQGDLEKSNAAQMAGWLYLAFTKDDVESGKAISVLEEVLSGP